MMPRFAVVSIVAVGLLLTAFAGAAWAGPRDVGSANSGSSGTGAAGALPRLSPTARTFGFAGPKPRDYRTASGIAKPTPAPRITAVARPAPGLGFASPGTTCTDCVECVEPATRTATGERSIGVRRLEVLRDSCDPCRSCGPQPVYCPPGCETCPPTRRIATDPLSVPATFWSSGYHDGASSRCDFGSRCDPCRTTCAPVCQPTCQPICDPCPPRRVVVRRPCRPAPRIERCVEPCAEPYATVCDPCPPRRRFVVRRACAPCGPRVVRVASPCGPGGPGWGGACGPAWGGGGPRWGGGCGPGWRGGCGPGWRGGWGGCGPCGWGGAAAAVGVGIGLAALPLLACGGCW